MLKAYVCYDAEDGCDDISSVEATTEARLNYCHLHIALVEVVEGHSCCHLEEGEVQLLHLFAVTVYEVHHLLLRNHLAIDTYALAEVHEVGRGEEASAVARLTKDRCKHM